MAPMVFAWLLLFQGSHAYTRFDMTCTHPNTSVNFVSSPEYRGTLEILWSCLFTIIVCTWTIQHLGIPRQRNNFEKKSISRAGRQAFLRRGPEIQDKSKAVCSVKVMAVMQVAWVSMQVIVRAARGLSISQLELVATALPLCVVITHVLLLPKPHGVQVPMRPIKLKGSQARDLKTSSIYIMMARMVTMVPVIVFFMFFKSEKSKGPFFDPLLTGWYYGVKSPPEARMSYDSWPIGWFHGRPMHALRGYVLGSCLGFLVFGAVYAAGWNLDFLMSLERVLWRVASILMMALPPLVVLPAFIASFEPLTSKISINAS